MMAVEDQLAVPRVNAGWVTSLFGNIKRFPKIDLLVQIITRGVLP